MVESGGWRGERVERGDGGEGGAWRGWRTWNVREHLTEKQAINSAGRGGEVGCVEGGWSGDEVGLCGGRAVWRGGWRVVRVER